MQLLHNGSHKTSKKIHKNVLKHSTIISTNICIYIYSYQNTEHEYEKYNDKYIYKKYIKFCSYYLCLIKYINIHKFQTLII